MLPSSMFFVRTEKIGTKLDKLTKEIIALAVSITNNCEY